MPCQKIRAAVPPLKTLCVIISFCVSAVFLLSLLAFQVQERKQSVGSASADTGPKAYSLADLNGLPLEIVHQFHDGMSPQEAADIVGDKEATEFEPPYGYHLKQGCSVIFLWDYTPDAKHGFGDPQAKELTRLEAMSRSGAIIYDSWHIHSPSDDSILSPD